MTVTMHIYRLDPIDPGHPSWDNSVEKATVWTCAPSVRDARDLVAARTGAPRKDAANGASPWQIEVATSCVSDPTVIAVGAGEVIRQDGSLVDYEHISRAGGASAP
jgi:hypothetical protein